MADNNAAQFEIKAHVVFQVHPSDFHLGMIIIYFVMAGYGDQCLITLNGPQVDFGGVC
jgi:hypothetical protein